MPKVIINEIDKTQYNVTTNASNNIVYIPGISVCGPTDKAYLCRSYTDFVTLFGSISPNRDEITITSWEYATSLLLIGFPVLFRRIVGDYDSTTDTYSLSDKASKVFADESEPAVTQFTVTAKECGTVGNDITVTLSKDYTITSNAVSEAGKFSIAISYTPYVGTSTGRSKGTEIVNTYETETFAVGTSDTDVFSAIKDLLDGIANDYVEIKTETTFAVIDSWFADGGQYALEGGTDPSEAQVMTYLNEHSAIIKELEDLDLFDVKFITLGGKFAADSSEITPIIDIIKLAAARGDAFALPDIPYSTNYTGNTDDVKEYFNTTCNLSSLDSTGESSFAWAVDPWIYMKLPVTTLKDKLVSPSFVWLYELAKSLKNGNPICLPPAGVNRALIPEIITPYFDVGSVRAESWGSDLRFVNPIRKIRNYGYAIYGQKTLYKVDGSTTVRSAFQDISVRITANEIKRKIRDVSIGLTFENNNLKTWNEFRAELDPFLMQLASDGALDNYKIIMDQTTTTEDDINNNTVRGTVIVQIARAAEDFNIDFIVTNSSAEFSESYS